MNGQKLMQHGETLFVIKNTTEMELEKISGANVQLLLVSVQNLHKVKV
jgi:hypothetical protein